MPQQGAIYGTVQYGNATYGKPLDLTGAVLPTYSAGPAMATPLDYQTMRITWSLPGTGTNIRLVRNGLSIPANETDGTILLVQPINGQPVFIDNTLTTDQGGQLLYYTLWTEDSDGNWWRAADIESILPKDWGYQALLASLLPNWYLEQDDAIAAVVPISNPKYPVIWASLTGGWDSYSVYTWDTIPPG